MLCEEKVNENLCVETEENQILTYEERVSKNLGLVKKVIKDKVSGVNNIGIFTYDDLVQIGRVGLCKAARKYDPINSKAKFSTYAYVSIRNEIYKALERATICNNGESTEDFETVLKVTAVQDDPFDRATDLFDVLGAIQAGATGIISKGIQALIMYDQGKSYKDIGVVYGVKPNLVTAWVAKTKKYLREHPDIIALRGSL